MLLPLPAVIVSPASPPKIMSEPWPPPIKSAPPSLGYMVCNLLSEVSDVSPNTGILPVLSVNSKSIRPLSPKIMSLPTSPWRLVSAPDPPNMVSFPSLPYIESWPPMVSLRLIIKVASLSTPSVCNSPWPKMLKRLVLSGNTFHSSIRVSVSVSLPAITRPWSLPLPAVMKTISPLSSPSGNWPPTGNASPSAAVKESAVALLTSPVKGRRLTRVGMKSPLSGASGACPRRVINSPVSPMKSTRPRSPKRMSSPVPPYIMSLPALPNTTSGSEEALPITSSLPSPVSIAIRPSRGSRISYVLVASRPSSPHSLSSVSTVEELEAMVRT